MRNPLTFRVESGIGAFIVLFYSVFMIGLIFTAISRFSAELDAMSVGKSEIKMISQAERVLITEWIEKERVSLPEGKGLRYLIKEYPSRPWASDI